MNTTDKELWFVTGSQHLYGPEVLKQVQANATTIAQGLNQNAKLGVPLQFKALVTTPEEIYNLCLEANANTNCVGLVLWMHTFSPAKMWINGMQVLHKPICHLHTQFNAEIPWNSIDMDFMNLNQSAHGGREFGFMATQLKKPRKVIVGHWQETAVQGELAQWSRVVLGWNALQTLKVARIGDNMREVAVTEGNKVTAQQTFGFSVNGYDTTDVLKFLPDNNAKSVLALLEEYEDSYTLTNDLLQGGAQRNSLVEAAKIEISLEQFLVEGGFGAFTDTFENLGDFVQLPGLAVQRLMAKGYGFGAEGDWKTAALLRAAKVMDQGLEGGTSFMEDYTYHFSPNGSAVLGAHMLEICPSIAAAKPSCEVHPLGIGGKADPARLVFTGQEGPAINASLIDLGGRYRLLVNEVESVTPPEALPNLPVASVLWNAKPNLKTAATSWILAGGAHHTVYSQALQTAHFEDLAEIADIELVRIDSDTQLHQFKQELRNNEVYYRLRGI